MITFLKNRSAPAGAILPIDPLAVSQIHEALSGSAMIVLSEPNTHLKISVGSAVDTKIFLQITERVSVLACEIILEKNSRAEIVMLESGKKISIVERTKIGENAHLHLQNISLGEIVTGDLQSTVEGAQGISSIDWLSYAKKTDNQQISVRNIFHARNGGGDVTMRSIGEGKASVDVKGMIDIGSLGSGTQTYLTQHVLMLDPTAKVDAQPALEIKTNDVKASHSASVSRVTPEDLYYFSARGIDPQEARGLLVKGFLGELVQKIGYPEAVDSITKAIEEKYAAK